MAEARRFPLHMTAEEYLVFDAAAPEGETYEWFDGLVVPRRGYDATGAPRPAGEPPAHSQVLCNVVAAIGAEAQRQAAHAYLSRQRVRTEARTVVYPDIALVCGEPVYSDDTPAILENATFVVEIASRTTEAADRGRKLTAYTALDSVQEYWIVASEVAEVTTFVRTGDAWQIGRTAGLGASVRCETLGLDVALEDVYALVTVGEADPYGR